MTSLPQSMRAIDRRWIILAVGVVVLLGLVFAKRNRGEPPTAEIQKAVSQSASDSIVALDSAAQRLVSIEIVKVQDAASSGLRLNGTITFDENHVSVIAPAAEGRIISVRSDLGQHVNPGAVLALLESSDVGSARGDLARARAAVEVSKGNYEREKRLFEQSVSSQKEMLDAKAAYQTALADFNSSSAKLRSLGAAGGSGATYGISTPISGTIVERNATPGQIAGPTTSLFTVADLSKVWITVDLYEADINRVRTGSPARVTTNGLQGESFPARITYAGGVVDTSTHTAKLRVEVPNPAGRLRPGMFAEVTIDVPARSPVVGTAGVLVPADAVQDAGGKSVVFVPGKVKGQFIARTVTVTGTTTNGMATVISGLRSGEQVVLKGAFQLKAALTKGSFGDDG